MTRLDFRAIAVVLALVALVASSCVNPARLDDVIGKPAVDQSRPAVVWRLRDRARIRAAVAERGFRLLLVWLVVTVILYSVWQFRMKPGEELKDGPPIHGNTRDSGAMRRT